ncbi:MAG TPA: chemotaxis protein CheW, partial [Bryobacteraceae bacterium]|nr:chemotaxis protein CheW [Bryobacteraceae bacterium]
MAPATRAGQYLTFRIAQHDFAMDAACVRGLLPARELQTFGESLRPMMGMLFRSMPAEWVCGFAHLSGADFPVVDLAAKLGFSQETHGRQSCIVAVEIRTNLAGFLADRVSDVVKTRERDFQNGKLRVGGRPRRILDPE